MKLSKLNELPTTREMIDVFGGYNHNLRIREGEFYDMENLTSADYPVLSPRPKRGIYESPTKPLGLISKDALCYVDGRDFIINKYRLEGILKNDKPKDLVSMGQYVIVMPDKVWIDTNSYESGNIDAYFEIVDQYMDNGFYIDYTPCGIDGETYEYDHVGKVAPPSPTDKMLWLDTSSTPCVLKRYSETNAEWLSIPTTYIKIKISGNEGSSIQDLTKLFSVGDGVVMMGLSGSVGEFNNKASVIKGIGVDYIIIAGIVGADGGQVVQNFSIRREMPDMDFVIESGNRLWGCRYGGSHNGKIVNEIYASKLGDFKNWQCYEGISTDSYAASLGADGQFTGAITYLGYPLFFRENCVHKVYGNFPSNYQIQTTACRGVQQGCSKSLAIVNETLYYKSRSGICAYDGSLPTEISSALGDVAYSDAVAGVLGNKYYISMKDETLASHLFVYDAMRGMWHREDNTEATEFCNSRGNLYYIDREKNKIKAVREIDKNLDPEEASESVRTKWSAVTGIIGTDSPDKKYISRLILRILLAVGTTVYCYVEYDSCGAWEHFFSISGTSLRSYTIPIKPKRCDHLRLKIVGEGEAKIYSITKTIEQGSDV